MAKYSPLINEFFNEMEVKLQRARTPKEKIKFNRELEYKFYDKVIMEIVAQELGGVAASNTFRNENLRVSNPKIGDVVNGRDVSIIGIYSGMPYSVSVSRRKLVSGYDRASKKFTTETTISNTEFNIKVKNADGVTEYSEEIEKQLIDTDIFPFFFGGMKQIRETYTEEYVMSLVEKTVNNIKRHIETIIRKVA